MRPKVSYKVNPTPKHQGQTSAKIISSSRLTWDPSVMIRKYTEPKDENDRFYFFLADATLKITAELKTN